MGTIKFNDSGMKDAVLMLTKRAKENLEAAKDVSSGIIIPGDFPQGGTIRSTPSKIYSIISKLNSVNSSINTSVNNFMDAERKNSYLANNLDNLLGSLSTKGSKMDINESVKTTKTSIANITNALLSIGKGALKVGEGILDTGALWGTIQANPIIKLFSFTTGQDLNSEMWKNTMGIVATDFVGNAFHGFYSNTKEGKWLDKNADNPFKSTGAVYAIGEQAGTIVAISVITALTGIPIGATAGLVEAGKGTERYWANARDSAEPGKDWRTPEVLNKGLMYGLTNGIWEGLQYSVGSEILGKSITGIPIADSFVRVTFDSGFNALDPVAKAGITTIIDGTSFDKAFEEQGGYTAMATAAFIGAIGSSIGEVHTYLKNSDEIHKGIRKKSNYDELKKYGKNNKIKGLTNNSGKNGLKSSNYDKIKTKIFGKQGEIKKLINNYKETKTGQTAKGEKLGQTAKGKKIIGVPITRQDEIAKQFSNSNNHYYGHGTQGIELDAKEVEKIISIFDNGLMLRPGADISKNALSFGRGSNELFSRLTRDSNTTNNINKWPHSNSKEIIIISFPENYMLGNGNYKIRPFCLKSAEGEYIRPEFIKGVYDANSGEFIQNLKYYENLPLEEQEKIFENLKETYIDEFMAEQVGQSTALGNVRGKYTTFEEYAGEHECPLTEEEIEQADRKLKEAVDRARAKKKEEMMETKRREQEENEQILKKNGDSGEEEPGWFSGDNW